MPRTYHHGDLRTALFEAALALLAEDGSDALSLRAVARRAGVSAMAPYRHYPDKQSLLAAVALHGFRCLREVLQQADRGDAAGQPLVAQAVAYVRFALENPALFRLMFGLKLQGNHPELVTAGEAAYGVLSGRIASGAARGGDNEARALGCWALVHGLAGLFLDGQVSDRVSGSEDEVTRRVAGALLDHA